MADKDSIHIEVKLVVQEKQFLPSGEKATAESMQSLTIEKGLTIPYNSDGVHGMIDTLVAQATSDVHRQIAAQDASEPRRERVT